jgi:hypothetical protein
MVGYLAGGSCWRWLALPLVAACGAGLLVVAGFAAPVARARGRPGGRACRPLGRPPGAGAAEIAEEPAGRRTTGGGQPGDAEFATRTSAR